MKLYDKYLDSIDNYPALFYWLFMGILILSIMGIIFFEGFVSFLSFSLIILYCSIKMTQIALYVFPLR